MNMRRDVNSGRAAKSELDRLVREETILAVAMQERFDIDIITNGEFSRDNYVSFVADRLDNIAMMSMSEMLPYIEDKKAFEQILDTLDVPSAAIKNAICTGKIEHTRNIVADEMAELREMTSRPIKATLPGPYLMTRSMWLPALSGQYYDSKEALGEDVIAVLKKEIDELEKSGTDVVQFDEPVLTEVVFTQGKTRSFMCAALSEKKDPTEELEFATHLIGEVMSYARNSSLTATLHVCRGNWSKDESILLFGSYTPLLKLFEDVKPEVLTLEYSTPRAGDLSSLLDSDIIKKQSKLGLGVLNPRIDVIESADSICERAEESLKWLSPDDLWLNPDCGFATFANRPVNTFNMIEKKLETLNKAKTMLRAKYE